MVVFVGDDWSEEHHDVHVMSADGDRLASCRLLEGVEGIAGFHELVASHADDPGEVIVGIETDRGLWVTALIAAGYQVYAINPLAASRYRERHHVSGAKSDAADAKMLADLVRTDRRNHRQVAGDTAEVEAIKIIARGHQNLIWARTRNTNALRATLRDYYPAALETFNDLADRDCLAVIAKAPTPTLGTKLTLGQIHAALKRGGRQRNIERRATEIHTGLRTEHLTAPPAVENAFAAITLSTIGIISELNRQISQLETVLTTNFEQHPDSDIYHSLPGFGVVLGARALGEFGDDPNRYANTKSRRNYAGTSPLTIASGKQRVVLARHIRNRRLYDALDRAAFSALTQSPGCRAYYDERRTNGDLHHQALRALANRLVSILHGCLTHHTPYNEHTAWNHRQPTNNQHAA